MKSHGIAAGLLFALAGLCMGQLPASAQSDYPNKAITMIVPFPAGGRTDVVGRIVAQELAKKLGKPVAVVNKPGASSVLGARELAESPPDVSVFAFVALERNSEQRNSHGRSNQNKACDDQDCLLDRQSLPQIAGDHREREVTVSGSAVSRFLITVLR